MRNGGELSAARAQRSGWLVLRVDAGLAEHGAEPFDLVGELLASLGQNRQCRVPGGPLLLPRGLTGQQFRPASIAAYAAGFGQHALSVCGARWSARQEAYLAPRCRNSRHSCKRRQGSS
jgi:hypothetical protein